MKSFALHERINRPMEFAGLQARFIAYGIAGSLSVFLLFALLYALGLPSLVCILLAGGLGLGLWLSIQKLSRRYGAHGLEKHSAYGRLPRAIRVYSHQVFNLELNSWKSF